MDDKAKKDVWDIGQIAASHDFDFEMKSRKTEDPADAKLRRKKDWWIFLVIVVAIIVSLGVCAIYFIKYPDSKHSGTALNGLVGITIALIGFYAGAKHKT